MMRAFDKLPPALRHALPLLTGSTVIALERAADPPFFQTGEKVDG